MIRRNVLRRAHVSRAVPIAATLLILCAQASLFGQIADPNEPIPSYTCRRLSLPPQVDGRLDDPAWRTAEWAKVGNTVGGTAPAHPEPTRFALLRDDVHLYFAADVEDREVLAAPTERDGRVWWQDCVEFYIDPLGKGVFFHEIDINALGDFYDGIVLFEPDTGRHSADPQWNASGMEIRTARRAEGWMIEGRIRLDSMPTAPRMPPRHGDRWRFNVYRLNAAGDETMHTSAWSATTSLQRTERFGELRFDDPERAEEIRERKEMARAFLEPENLKRALRIATPLEALTVERDTGERYVFHAKEARWLINDRTSYVAQANVPDFPHALLVRNGFAPLRLSWPTPAAAHPRRAVMLARLDPTVLWAVNWGRADGVRLRLECGDGAVSDTLHVLDGEWQMARLPLPHAGGRLILTATPGPAENTGWDRTQVLLFLVPDGDE